MPATTEAARGTVFRDFLGDLAAVRRALAALEAADETGLAASAEVAPVVAAQLGGPRGEPWVGLPAPAVPAAA